VQVKDAMFYMLDATIAAKGVFSCIIPYDARVRAPPPFSAPFASPTSPGGNRVFCMCR
jgi:hypothetical protein